MKMYRIVFTLFSLLCLLPLHAVAADCFSCHDQAAFKGRVVHEPVAKAQCATCHSPHVAKHEGLLLQKEAELCFSCHPQIAQRLESSPVAHQPVKQGQCSECHTPHASANADLLKQSGRQLCVGCHDELQQDYQVVHQPFKQGQCSACHDAHAGTDYRMLKKAGSQLCFDCHKVTKALQASHLDRNLRQVDCLGCHNPHGGNNRSLLRAVSHAPFADNNCNSCHGRTTGVDLCLNCHAGVLDSFNQVHTHLGVGGPENPCTVCHNPHVGDRPGLLPTNEGSVCRDCHANTFAKRDKMLHKHPGWNSCSDCHLGHGGDHPAMLKNGSNVCNQCHELHSDFSHPQGEEILDPRNGRSMDCLSCHDANAGTMYKYFLHGSGERGLCVKCHQSY